MNIIKLDQNNKIVTEKVSEIIRNNGIVILAFDTVYGYACNPKSDGALEKIFQLKERDLTKTIGLAISSIDTIEEISQINETSKSFIQDKTPGKYTFIVKINKNAGLSKYCIQNETIGIRIPESDFVLNIIAASGGLIAQTSANKSGMPDCYSIDELLSQYTKEELDQIDLIVNGGELEKSGASRIFDLTKNEPIEIDRI